MSKTFIAKSPYFGWNARTLFELPQLSDKSYLEIVTMKRSGGLLCTTASVQKESTDGFLSHTMYQDFNKTLFSANLRCTEKTVSSTHELQIKKFDELVQEIVEFYNKKAV